MFKKWIVVLGTALFLCPVTFAETVYLKNGQVIEGQIIERKPIYIMIQVAGAPYKYYKQQIDHIEENKKELPALHQPGAALENMRVEGISEEKVKLITELMEAAGIKTNMEKNFQLILAQAPVEKKEELEKLLDIRAIFQKIIPIYDKYYSDLELRQLIDFHRSPLGVKTLEATPKILKEAAEASIEYFKENSPPH